MQMLLKLSSDASQMLWQIMTTRPAAMISPLSLTELAISVRSIIKTLTGYGATSESEAAPAL